MRGGLSHAARRHSDSGIRPGAAGCPWCHGGHSDAQLEGEHERVDEHHDPHLPDAGAVDGLRVLQRGGVQLHHEELAAVAARLFSGHASRHGSMLHAGHIRTLPCLSWAQMYPLGGQPPSQGAHVHRCGGMFRPVQPSLPGSCILVHQWSHHCLPDHRPARQQQISTRGGSVHHICLCWISLGWRGHFLPVLSWEEIKVAGPGHLLWEERPKTGEPATEAKEKCQAADGRVQAGAARAPTPLQTPPRRPQGQLQSPGIRVTPTRLSDCWNEKRWGG